MIQTEKILWDVDTQNDLILPGGDFSVPGAYLVADNFGRAIRHFEKKGFPVLGVVDAHIGRESVIGTRDENLPLHCIKGTFGQLKISQTQGDILFVSDQVYSDEAIDLVVVEIKAGRRVYFEKQQQSQISNPNIPMIMKKLGVKEVYFIGLLINVCIRLADLAFKSMGIKTFLVEGAVHGVDFPDSNVAVVTGEMFEEGTEYYKFN